MVTPSMPGPAPKAPTSNGGPRRLTGWKEIAAYLNRGVRTVQRWEKENGLPVRRFGTSKPESVVAIPQEIDAWLETAQGISARSGPLVPGPDAAANGEADDSPSQELLCQGPPPLFGRIWLLRMSVVALATAVTVFVIWAGWGSSRLTRQGAPAKLSVTGAAPVNWYVDLDAVGVTDINGNAIWRHTFPRELLVGAYVDMARTSRNVLGGVADIDADGFREVWFVARYAGLSSPSNTELYVFEHDGRVRWTYQPFVTVRFGADTFGPSWIVEQAYITPDPEGGNEKALWVVLYHSALFPSALQRLDPRSGSATSTYWSNGSILTMTLDLEGGRHRLLVGACDNERKAGSLAVLDALNPNGSAPAEVEKYRCTSCPPGEPQAFLVFPKPARFGPTNLAGPVSRISTMADGGLVLGVEHAWIRPDLMAMAFYSLDPSLVPSAVDTGDDYEKVLRMLVQKGDAPTGAPAKVDPVREFLPILRWDPAGRRYTTVSLHR
jgi:hypothetical protein